MNSHRRAEGTCNLVLTLLAEYCEILYPLTHLSRCIHSNLIRSHLYHQPRPTAQVSILNSRPPYFTLWMSRPPRTAFTNQPLPLLATPKLSSLSLRRPPTNECRRFVTATAAGPVSMLSAAASATAAHLTVRRYFCPKTPFPSSKFVIYP